MDLLERIFGVGAATKAEVGRLREQVSNEMRVAGKARGRGNRRLEEVESDVRLLSLLGRAMLQVLAERGLCTMADLAARMQSIDAADGHVDGGLEPQVLATELGVRRPAPDKKATFLRSIASKRSRAPRDRG